MRRGDAAAREPVGWGRRWPRGDGPRLCRRRRRSRSLCLRSPLQAPEPGLELTRGAGGWRGDAARGARGGGGGPGAAGGERGGPRFKVRRGASSCGGVLSPRRPVCLSVTVRWAVKVRGAAADGARRVPGDGEAGQP